jgi:type II secretory ATPase GspE/PulE/Tfp pilus assembly ATPase PilB-like protein
VGRIRPGIPPITEILLEAGVVAAEQVEAALEHQRASGIRVGEALVELGAASEYDICWALARQLGYTYLDLTPEALDPELVRSFPEPLLRRFLAVPLVRTDESLSVAFGDPTDRGAIAELERAAGTPIVPSVAAPSMIRQALDLLVGPRTDARRRLGSAAPDLQTRDGSVSREGSGAALLAGHIRRALLADAHEIHFLPAGEEMRVHHRLGGALVYAGSGPESIAYLLLARLETLGGPTYDGEQTHARGRAVCPLGEQDVVLDVSLLRSEAGLAIVLGLRGAGGTVPALEELGMDALDLACVRGVLDQPSGLVLVSGPSRSGCSTTLASMLGAVPLESRRSVAFERATGTPLPSPTRLSLAPDVVRACWREIVVGQSADVVAVDDAFTGEHVSGLLDTDTSGRLVLATTDWSESFALLGFLASRPGGAEIVADRLRLVIQQRMACFEPGAAGAEGGSPRMRPVIEVLAVTDAMRDALRAGAPTSRLRELAAADRHHPLADRLRSLVAAGRISAAEAARIAG